MKHPVLMLLGLLAVAAFPAAQAVEILRWERMPLAVPLKVGQERIVFIDRNVRVGVPAGVGERLRVQSAGGAVYLRASEPIEPTRLQLQDADTGALILLDIAAEAPKDGEAELEPVRIVEDSSTPARYGDQSNGAEAPARAHLAAAGVAGRFDFIAGSDSGHGAKPAPGQLLAFADAAGLAPASVLMIGDSRHDLTAGRAAGMGTVGVLTGPATARDLADLADAVLPDIGHLGAYLTARMR